MVVMDAEKVLKAVGERIIEESSFRDEDTCIKDSDLTALSHLVDSYNSLLRTVNGD